MLHLIYTTLNEEETMDLNITALLFVAYAQVGNDGCNTEEADLHRIILI